MLRTALRPRWLALMALVLAAASVMAWLGQWQLDRARENGGEQQKQEQARPVTALDGVLRARQTFPGRGVDLPVTTAGTWDAAHQLLVADRRDTTSANGDVAGPHGFWVLTPLRLPDGSAVPVVRGWVATADDPAAVTSAVPTGTVIVTGFLEPSEPPDETRLPGQSSGLPPGQIELVDVTYLIRVWPYPLLTGYVLLNGQTPASATVPTHLVGLQAGDSAMALQNLSYAIQWFLFAGFGLYLWWRLVLEDHRGTLGRGRRDSSATGAGAPGGTDHPGDGGGDPGDGGGDPGDGGGDPAHNAAGPVGDDGAPTPAVGGAHP